MVRRLRTPATTDTTSEPYARKCHAGCARYRVNEWRFYGNRNQGGTVEYDLYPTPDAVQGWDFYICHTPVGADAHIGPL